MATEIVISSTSVVAEGRQWLRGTDANAGRFPGQIAEKLAGRSFDSFDDFRQAFWREVANDPVLSKQFDGESVLRMQTGRAPLAPFKEQVGLRHSYELDHTKLISDGGGVYDMENIVIRTPYNHISRHAQ